MRVLDLLKMLLVDWPGRKRQRQTLAGMTVEELLDLGISREAALAESRKPFWVTAEKTAAPARQPARSPAAAAASQNPAAQR